VIRHLGGSTPWRPRPKILDALIAATALSRAIGPIPLYTQNADFEDMAGVGVVLV